MSPIANPIISRSTPSVRWGRGSAPPTSSTAAASTSSAGRDVEDQVLGVGALAQLAVDLIETISSGLTLQPGDVIATGTPAGVGIGFNPPRFLKRGDVMEIEIAGLGRLSNPIA